MPNYTRKDVEKIYEDLSYYSRKGTLAHSNYGILAQMNILGLEEFRKRLNQKLLPSKMLKIFENRYIIIIIKNSYSFLPHYLIGNGDYL